MDAFFSLMHGFEVLLTPMNVGYMVVGILFGVLLGFLPGVGGANGIAAHVLDAQHHRHHHAGGNLLGRAVRRLHQRHSV